MLESRERRRTRCASPARPPLTKAKRLFMSRRRQARRIWCDTFFKKAPGRRLLTPAAKRRSTWRVVAAVLLLVEALTQQARLKFAAFCKTRPPEDRQLLPR